MHVSFTKTAALVAAMSDLKADAAAVMSYRAARWTPSVEDPNDPRANIGEEYEMTIRWGDNPPLYGETADNIVAARKTAYRLWKQAGCPSDCEISIDCYVDGSFDPNWSSGGRPATIKLGALDPEWQRANFYDPERFAHQRAFVVFDGWGGCPERRDPVILLMGPELLA